MHALPFHRIAILGMGLIGSSLARALTARNPGLHIAAFDLSQDTLKTAADENFVHSTHAHAGQATQDADIVVIAVPPGAYSSVAADIAPFLKPGAVVTDVGSVKRHAVSTVTAHLPKHAFFVPGHPIAGSEHRGIAAGRADLFAGKRVILTPAEEELRGEPVARVRAMWELANARVEYMPSELHDRIYAYVSHLPQLVAYASKMPMDGIATTGDETLKRFTRLMHSNTALWVDICMHNADYISEALNDFMAFAAQMEGELAEAPAAGGTDATLVGALFPRVVATCLIATASLLQELTGVHPARYAGSGFADMTAPAVSDPQAALEAISAHNWVIARMLKSTLVQLQHMHAALESQDREALLKAFSA